ncbi:19507_t:CDS:2, partial [Racocetra persica]
MRKAARVLVRVVWIGTCHVARKGMKHEPKRDRMARILRFTVLARALGGTYEHTYKPGHPAVPHLTESLRRTMCLHGPLFFIG